MVLPSVNQIKIIFFGKGNHFLWEFLYHIANNTMDIATSTKFHKIRPKNRWQVEKGWPSFLNDHPLILQSENYSKGKTLLTNL